MRPRFENDNRNRSDRIGRSQLVQSRARLKEVRQFLRGKIIILEDEPTVESILRTLREMYAEPDEAPDPPSIPEKIERAIRE